MNKVTLIGNVTRNPELTTTANGVSVCHFSLAVDRSYTGADGERKTDFFNCIAWRGLADSVARYVHRGDKIAVSGSLETDNYENANGNKRTSFDIVASDVEFLVLKNNMRPDMDSDG